jgi:intein/homing endonuclease
MKYKKITKKELEKYFKIQEKNLFFILRYGKGRNLITIKKNFFFDEDLATLVGLMPDGSLIKDIMRIYFHQKKDITKIYLFRDLIKKFFNITNRIFIRQKDQWGTYDLFINSQTLARFFYHILYVSKSNEKERIPTWIYTSPDSVKFNYIRSIYDMEGTILKNLREIRFITKDHSFAQDIKKLLSTLDVTCHIRPRIGGTHRTIQYRVSIYRISNFKKFKKIGFTVPY